MWEKGRRCPGPPQGSLVHRAGDFEATANRKPLNAMDITLREHCARIAKAGGAAKSEKKAAAARANARKPRPKARELNALKRAKKSETNS